MTTPSTKTKGGKNRKCLCEDVSGDNRDCPLHTLQSPTQMGTRLRYSENEIRVLGIVLYKRRIPDGWQDLGQVKSVHIDFGISERRVHSYCGTVIHVGSLSGDLFHFCPKCWIITN